MSMPTDPGYQGDPDDLAFLGPSSPAAGEVFDPRARLGRLTPLSLKLDAAYQGIPVGDQALAVAAQPVPLAVPADAASATIQVQTAPIRWTFDGSPPAAGHGFRADPGAIVTVSTRGALQALQMIQEGAGAGAVYVTYWS